jgi:hypothetical protein
MAGKTEPWARRRKRNVVRATRRRAEKCARIVRKERVSLCFSCIKT